jgi:hypothetical protein
METQEFLQCLERIIYEVSGGESELFYGWIESGFKFLTQEVNEKNFRTMCDSKCKLFVGFDFVNEEDQFLALEEYDPLVDKVLADYPDLCHLKKVYHAG